MWMLWAWVASSAAQELLDVNAANEQELDALPGLGPAKSRALVLWREEKGPCRDVSDLASVPGWGPATLAALRSRIACGSGQALANVRGPTHEGDPEGPALHTERVDINQAGPSQLTQLPGISPARAKAIVAHRTAHGPFGSCAELVRIPGLGPATVTLLASRCTVGRARSGER